jgi:hypothetical protein
LKIQIKEINKELEKFNIKMKKENKDLENTNAEMREINKKLENRNKLFKNINVELIKTNKDLENRNKIIENINIEMRETNKDLENTNTKMIETNEELKFLMKNLENKIEELEIKNKELETKIKLIQTPNKDIKSTNLEFHLFGNGPSKKEVSTYLNFKNIYLHDRVNASEFQYILSNSQAAFLPIKNRFDFLKSIPNKVVDSIQYKLPIFTCLLGETKSIVQKYNLGFIYGDHHDLQDQLTSFCNGLVYGKIKKNYENPELQKIFDHNLNYQKILDKIA